MLLVQKFGGTSVGSIARIHNVASLALRAQRNGAKVVVVVSAMAGETNRLLGLCDQTFECGSARERDTIAACGEQISAGLTALAIEAGGGRARSFCGHQVRILTDGRFGDAEVSLVETQALKESLARGEIPVVAGFQGLAADGSVTTLGRGGSDTSAVALAHALGAERCDIYTDVDGVYTADPNIVPQARKLARVSYDVMLTFARLGAKVLHDRSVAYAKTYQVPVQVLSSFGDIPGTMIYEPEFKPHAAPQVGGLALERKLYCMRTADAVNLPRVEAHLRAEKMDIVASFGGEKPLIVVRALDLAQLREKLRLRADLPIVCWGEIHCVSLVGAQLNRSFELQATELLRGLGVRIQGSVIGGDFCSLYIAPDYSEESMRLLHHGLNIGLGAEHGTPTEPPPGR